MTADPHPQPDPPGDGARAAEAAGGPAAPVCRPDPSGRCVTCADEGVEGRVVAMLGDSLASVEMEGRVEEVAIELLDEVAVGDHVLVHAGVALARLER